MKSQIEKTVFETIRKFNQSNKDGFTLKPDKKTTLTGSDASIDSVALIGFLLDLEKNLYKNFKKKITIADEKVFQDIKILKNVGSLINHISSKINVK
tara:strand:- start:204 stop:494 length:291 start_codon:yes stop_codon:yes gene_type:complete